MTKADKIREFLRQVPDEFILSEAGRRQAARRSKDQMGRSEKLRPCKFCGEKFGTRKMREHLSSAHPGGERAGYKVVVRTADLPRPCPQCGELLNYRSIPKHMRGKHPEIGQE